MFYFEKRRSRRRQRNVLFALGCFFISGVPLLAHAYPCNSEVNNLNIKFDKSPGLDVEQFVETVVDGMSNSQVKGYALNIYNKWGSSVGSATKGLARTQCDVGGQQAFTLNTETPWGSVSKLITTAAAVHAVDHYPVSLDDHFIDYLPYRWRSEVHSRFANVTLGMLLQHKAGFRHGGCNKPIRQRLIDGDIANDCGEVDPPPEVGTRSYSNTGPGLYYLLLAYITRPSFMGTIEFGYQYHDDASYDAIIQDYTASIYNSYVEDNVFAPINITGTCNMASNFGGNYSLWYDSTFDASGTLPPDHSGHCSSGAWSMSSNEMTKLLSSLRNTESILGHASYNLMESSWSDSLGWWRGEGNTGSYYTHNGAWGGTRSQVYSLPGHYTATLVTNSPPANGVSLATVLKEAYDEARVDGVAQDAASLLGWILD